MKKIILFGAPGSGKGTQATQLTARMGIPAISTGQLLRKAVSDQTELGRKVKGLIDAGNLVPDEMIIELVCHRLAEPDCTEGFILDGFPRTIFQAEALDSAGVEMDCVLNLEVPDEEIERRVTGRRICNGCGEIYHIQFNPPRQEGQCDQCGGTLARRDDDTPEVVRDRLRVFHESTEPLKGWYERRGKLITVIAQHAVTETTAAVFTALGLDAL